MKLSALESTMCTAPMSRRIFACSALRTMLTSGMPSLMQMRLSICPRFDAAAVFTVLTGLVGAITANPSDFIFNDKRKLTFSPGFTVTARNRREFSFGLTIPITMPVGSYPLSVDANTVVNSQRRLVKLIDVAPI